MSESRPQAEVQRYTFAAMSEQLRISQVFVPGKLPEYTYNSRDELGLEADLEDYVDEAGAILTVAGPTKTGKSVLLRRVIRNPVWIDGAGIEDVDAMWAQVGDALGAYTTYELGSSQGDTGRGQLSTEGGFTPVLKVGVQAEYSASAASDTRVAVQRPMATVARQTIEQSGRALVIDDFHFIGHGVQRNIVRALKPLVLAGVPVILVSISHRAHDVVTAEKDLGGRVSALAVSFWSDDELLVIAQKGFEALNVVDAGDEVGRVLAKNSYGSPHLMQQFCREICKAQRIRETQAAPYALEAPESWATFFEQQVDDASADWFTRLLRGPQERGRERNKWTMRGTDTPQDGYGLTLRAVAETGPKLAITKDEIKAAVDSVVVGVSPQAHQTTRVLQHMSAIAATRLSEPQPTADELDTEDPDATPDAQPVLEYVEDGPNSVLHIADPFFAFYLRWGTRAHLDSTGD